MKTIATAILGGVLGMFARSTDSEAATRRVLWAVINGDGTRKRGKGVTTSNKIRTGEYEIRFERNVDKCAYSVTMDHNSGFAFISLLDPDTSARIVGVTTLDRAGIVRDTSFHLVVNCRRLSQGQVRPRESPFRRHSTLVISALLARHVR